MRYLSILLLIFCINTASAKKQSSITNITVLGDTVFNNNKPFCLLNTTNSTYTIRDLDFERIVEISPHTINDTLYFKLEFPIQYQTFYTRTDNKDFAMYFVHELIKYKVVEEGYYNEYGARKLIDKWVEQKRLIDQWKFNNQKNTTPKWIISYDATDNQDSTIITVDGKPFAYYRLVNFQDDGADQYDIAVKTKAMNRYILFDMNNMPLAEVRVPGNWGDLYITIVTADNFVYKFKYTSKSMNILTIATKLLLARNIEAKK